MKFEQLVQYANRCKELNKPMQLLVEMPGFQSPEMIVNPPENIDDKMAYYANTYDENCEHKHAKGIAIIDAVFGMDISEENESFTAITKSPTLENNFKYHTPKNNQPERYETLRNKAKELAYTIDELCPNSREKSLAHTNLEQATMWANASIARNE